ELWDDCMSFPNLHVRVKRHFSCTMNFVDENWEAQSWFLENELSELMQHEFDHLNGTLATQRAINNTSFKYVSV
ncbi:MAG: peptide deformylase, partial [Saprospiraceae bacterium]|nr:peptide deformylase [Saprospiraceae bacterium]